MAGTSAMALPVRIRGFAAQKRRLALVIGLARARIAMLNLASNLGPGLLAAPSRRRLSVPGCHGAAGKRADRRRHRPQISLYRRAAACLLTPNRACRLDPAQPRR